MRRLLVLFLLLISMLLGCDTISNINEVGKGKLLTSQFIGSSGGTLEYRKPDSHSDGVSIIVDKSTVINDINFSIGYFESFPKKPKEMKPESIAFEFKFESELNKRVKIIVPFISDVMVQKGLALFNYNKNDRKWHFAGGCSLNISTKTVSAMIDSPGIFAVMRLEDNIPSEVLSDFEVGFDTFNAPGEFTSRYCHGSTSFALWFYNKMKFSSHNLYDRYSNLESLLVARAACAEFDKTQFTSASELYDNAELSGANAVMYIKTALAFENRPIVAVLDGEHTVIINKYQDYDFFCYDPFEGNIEQRFSYEPISGNLVYRGDVIDKIAFFGMLETCYKGFREIYNYFENATTLVKDEVVGTNGDNLKVSSGKLANFEFNITQNAVTNDRHIQVYEISNLPNPPVNASLHKPLFRLLGPVDSMFNEPVEITIRYADADNDGFIDGTSISETDIYVAAYNFDTESWAPTEILSSDSFFNTMTVSSYYASDFGLFGIEPLAVAPKAEYASTTVFSEWPIGESVETLIDNTSKYNLNGLYVSAFDCIDFRQFNVRFNKEANMSINPGFSWSHSWYIFTDLINKCTSQNVDLYLIISCFDYANSVNRLYIDNVEISDSHSYYIVNTLIPYIIEQLPGIKGIMLRNVAYDKRIHTQLEVDMLSRFIARVREKLGKKNNSKLKLIVEVEPLIGNDCGNLFGQRYTDFSKYADVLLLKTFDKNLMPFDQEDQTKKSIEQALIACTPDNACSLQVQVSSSANANTVSIVKQLDLAMRYYATGFTIVDFPATSQSEWNSIGEFTPQN